MPELLGMLDLLELLQAGKLREALDPIYLGPQMKAGGYTDYAARS